MQWSKWKRRIVARRRKTIVFAALAMKLFSMGAMMGKLEAERATGEPSDTESGHAWFGRERLEKYPSGQLAGRLPYGTHGFEG